ncbi:MAG: aminotransferase class V-fold PLP-dependent enzyme [Undibacterium sp.]|nr:aminotransferase class V-fold PLP-dependent enzyme [Opitutaceae bacterium]
MIYLDHNATTPLRPEVFEVMRPFLTERWGNPSSSYAFGSQLKGVIEEARGHVAALIGASGREVVFTGSATESNNTALYAALSADPAKRHIITSAVEHSAVLTHTIFLEKHGYRVTRLPVDREGLLDIAALEAALTPDTAVVSLMWANNETGVLFPVAAIAALCQQRGVRFHCDAVQAVGKLPINLKTLPIDYLSLSAHKLGGPKGVGALFVRKTAPFTAYLHGGHQERGRRGGTENVAGIAGLGHAAALARAELPGYATTVQPLRDRLETELLARIPHAERNGHATQRLPNTTNLTFPGIESEALLLLLDQAGICASAGSACLADSDEPSHVVRAMKPDGTASRQMVRFSLGRENTAADVTAAVCSVVAAVGRLHR